MDEITVVENAVETAVIVDEVSEPVVEETVSSENQEIEIPVDSPNEIDNSLIEERAEAEAKVAQAKATLAEATQNLKEAKANLKSIKSTCKSTKVKKLRTKGFCGKNAMDVVLVTLKEMNEPTSAKDLANHILESSRYNGPLTSLLTRTSTILNALADVGTVKKEGDWAAKFQVV